MYRMNNGLHQQTIDRICVSNLDEMIDIKHLCFLNFKHQRGVVS